MACLEGKVALVTGASSGIGEGIALLLAERGASIALCGRDHERLRTTLDKCKETSGHKDRFLTLYGDLDQSEVRKRLVQESVKKFGQLDILVVNAGLLTTNGGIEKDTEEVFDFLFNTNMKSVYFLLQEALPELEKTKGNVVMTSSIASIMCPGHFAIYAASKAAVDNLAKTLCQEFGRKGVRINSVNPTFLPTRLFYDLVPDGQDKEEGTKTLVQSKAEFHPLEGRCGSIEDMTKVVAFLVSDQAAYITGQNLCVDGGVTRNFSIFQNL